MYRSDVDKMNDKIYELCEFMVDNLYVEQNGHPFCFKQKKCEYNRAMNDVKKKIVSLFPEMKDDIKELFQ